MIKSWCYVGSINVIAGLYKCSKCTSQMELDRVPEGLNDLYACVYNTPHDEKLF